MTRSAVIALTLLFLLAAVFFLVPDDSTGPLSRTRLLMGTVVEIRIEEPESDRFADAVTTAFDEISRIEKLMSPHLPDSDISRISRSDGPVEVAAETMTVLQLGQKVAKASDGAFEMGLGRLIRLWGFADGQPQIPEEAAIREALQGTGPDALLFAGSTVRKSGPELAVDLAGIAKGYAIDRAVEVLAAAGVRSASVNAGGDMRLLGDRGGEPWRIGIQHPRHGNDILARLNLSDRAVVTSGDYERMFVVDGIRYHHLLDPATGYPAGKCQAVTVVADNAALADAVATAVFVLGPEAGMQLLAETPDVEGLIIAADGSVSLSAGLREKVTWQ